MQNTPYNLLSLLDHKALGYVIVFNPGSCVAFFLDLIGKFYHVIGYLLSAFLAFPFFWSCTIAFVRSDAFALLHLKFTWL